MARTTSVTPEGETPLVSVVIPAYNQEKYITKTIQCIQNQDADFPFELLVINDGSTDETAPMVKGMASADGRIKLFSQPNQGLSAARNQGIAQSSGKYLLFLDADDLVVKNYLRSQTAKLEQDNGHDIVICGHILFHEKENNFQPGFLFKDAHNLHLLANNIAPVHSCLFRSYIFDCIGNYDTNLPALEDYDLLIRATSHGFKFCNNLETLAIYRKHEKNCSNNTLLMQKIGNIITKKIEFIFNEQNENCRLFPQDELFQTTLVYAASFLSNAFQQINYSKSIANKLSDKAAHYIRVACEQQKRPLRHAAVVYFYAYLIRRFAVHFADNAALSTAMDRLSRRLPAAFDGPVNSGRLDRLLAAVTIPSRVILDLLQARLQDVASLL